MNKITEFKFIPTTETSTPFAGAADKCRFDEIGYIEDEYFQTGTANVYDEDAEHNVFPIYENAPYTTRVIIRRPADVSKFSGNVVLEILNSSANIDIDRMWVNSWPYLTRNGDIFVGISSKGHVVDSLKGFDPKRYEAINWDNPMPEREVPEEVKTGRMRYLPQYELGLFWDMLLDLAKLLRSDSEMNPIREYGKIWLYLTGWSQSTSYVNRIVRCFAKRENACLFDGYYNGGGSAGLAPLSNSQPFRLGAGEPQSSINGAPQPFIAVNTESENRGSYWYGDFDEPDFKFRTWQIAGSSHDSKYNLVDYYGEKDLKMLESLGIYNAFYGVDGEALDSPYEPVFSAAWKALYLWVRNGIPAPHAPKIEVSTSFTPSQAIGIVYADNRTDAFGNCLGGIRIPYVVYPTARISSSCTYKDGRINGAFGKVNPFSAEFLQELYGSLEHYSELVNQEYNRLVAQGFLLEEDREANLGHTIECARKRGLK
ncbi:MAG: hypothetical protein IJJ44_00380 [Solobacterium sp.]|nr:hypothetical protein [Solobacterium sp.]